METGKTALIIGNGEVSAAEIEQVADSSFDAIIAADGGARKALATGLRPDVVIGDFDSIDEAERSELPGIRWIHQPSQDMNDLEKVLQFCRSEGFGSLTLIGICGDRLDHTLTNFSVLCRYDRLFNLMIYDAYSRIFLVRDAWRWNCRAGQLISLVPLGRVEGVTTNGLAFPLKDESLAIGEREGLSNYALQPNVEVSITDGILIIFLITVKSER